MTPEETYILLREMDELRERDSARLMDLQHAREEARADGAAAERAAVVAWLRSEAFVMEFRSKRNLGRRLADVAADAIERGEHLEKT